MSSVKRAYQVCREGGIKALIVSAMKWYRRRGRAWTRFGPLGFLLAKHFQTMSPPLLILSLPRSGSSWVGEILGAAENGLYLREPLTQGLIHCGLFESTVFEVDPKNPPEVYERCADHAFAGFPAFPDDIVRNKHQWSLLDRSHRRLVVKEVNPLAIAWLLQRYQPRVLFLIRHPAAVASSYQRLGWRDFSTGRDWRKHGEYQGKAHRAVLDSLKCYHDYRVIQYEKLSADPIRAFRELFRFAGLIWSLPIERLVRETTSGGDRTDPYSVTRNSHAMIEAWKERITNEQLQCLRDGYSSYALPWYAKKADWYTGMRTRQDVSLVSTGDLHNSVE